jgi:superfamily II DNA/RNA helicase
MMRDPQVVRVRGPSDVTVELVVSKGNQLMQWMEREKEHEPEVWLRQVRQYYRVLEPHRISSKDPLSLKGKLVQLVSLLSDISFNQCIVFCNDKFRAEALATALVTQGWPTAAITGAQPQVTRNLVMEQFRSFALRVLVSTDLVARGIDVDTVSFVVNLDLPRDPATYLHRVGRTGRFGGKICGPCSLYGCFLVY